MVEFSCEESFICRYVHLNNDRLRAASDAVGNQIAASMFGSEMPIVLQITRKIRN